MLKLVNIKKTYGKTEDTKVEALKGVSLNFRKNEFVAVLGPSGCGKTTLLNIIGGLDRYTEGDLIINGKSTKEYTDKDWDTYRNHSIGFVFQSYNLIPHLTVLENVELALQIGGISHAERRNMAKEALIKVGLKSKLKKKPNELSGGQMQRVSIARALVGNPDIILADEPTGALDTETSLQIMDLLKEISKERLVIMVTHNPDLANRYANRIIRIIDGEITGDTNPYDGREIIDTKDREELKRGKKHASMSFFTAFKLSALNLISKKKRTLITSIASSIGILGIALILSLSSGMQAYIDQTMADSASFNYIFISKTNTTLSMESNQNLEPYTEGVKPYVPTIVTTKKQNLSKELIDYLNNNTKGLTIDIAYTYAISMNVLTQNNGSYVKVSTTALNEILSNHEYIAQYYDVLAKLDGYNKIPVNENEVALVVDKYNRISTSVLTALGISYDNELTEIPYTELLGKEYKVIFNDSWYTFDGSLYRIPTAANYENVYQRDGITLKITSILREKEDAPASWLTVGLNYSPKLTAKVLENSKNSAVAVAQFGSHQIDVTTGEVFSNPGIPGGIFGNTGNTYESKLEALGYTQTPTSITIYPKDVNSRKKIVSILDEWNEEQKAENESLAVDYVDMSTVMTSILNRVVNVITYVLMAFSIVSLVISSIMIAIIIYASVIERTREIGVLRSLGARKKDVGRIFNAEAMIIGLTSGVIAIVSCYLLNIVINWILNSLLGVAIASLPFLYAILLILLSVFLLFIASLVPARLASKKDPVVALRTE